MMKRWLALLSILAGGAAGCTGHQKSPPAPIRSSPPAVPRKTNRPAALPIGMHSVPALTPAADPGGTAAANRSDNPFVGTWKLDYPLTAHEIQQLKAPGRPPVATATYHLKDDGTFTVNILDGAGGGIYNVDGKNIRLVPTVMKGEILTPVQQEKVSIEGVLDAGGHTIDFSGHKAVKQ